MNPEPNILARINHIRFPCLRVLCLTNHGICSIEGLSELKAPALDYISLGFAYLIADGNNITNLRPLQRAGFHSLTAFSISTAPFTQTLTN